MEKRVFNNAKWIIICRVGQSLLQLLVGMITARYLGPSNYGLINYAASVVAFVLPFVQLGMPSTLVQELIDTPEREGEIMGTAMLTNLLSGMACLVLTISFVFVANHGEQVTLIVCTLYSLSLLFRAMELMNYWFQYKLKSKYPSIIMLGVSIVLSIYKVYIVITEKSIYWFAIISTIEFALSGLAMVIIYSKMKTQKFKFSRAMAKRLFHRSKYFILAAAMVTVFQNTDHIMLKMMSEDSQNGFYTAAITCATVFHFLYFAIVDSVRPVILENKKAQSLRYGESLANLYSIVIYMAFAQAIVFTALAKPIVVCLYGIEYLEAAPVLQIVIWQIAFSHIGTVRNIWMLAEEKEPMIWKINLTGALLNILVNALLIPHFGACGAAFASLATQIFTNFILTMILPVMKENRAILLMGMKPKRAVAFTKKMLFSEMFGRKKQ
jgi:O-antigen/teichoic acid export membrane protein